MGMTRDSLRKMWEVFSGYGAYDKPEAKWLHQSKADREDLRYCFRDDSSSDLLLLACILQCLCQVKLHPPQYEHEIFFISYIPSKLKPCIEEPALPLIKTAFKIVADAEL